MPNPVYQSSRLSACRSCRREVYHIRDIENAATPNTSKNWLCPSCGFRTPASQFQSFIAGEMSTPDKATPGAFGTATPSGGAFTLASPDAGGYASVVRP